MIKRALSVLLILCVALAALPVPVLADSAVFGAFTVTGSDFSRINIEYNESNKSYKFTIVGSAVFTFSQANHMTNTTKNRIAVADGVSAYITLDGVNIDTGSMREPAIDVLGTGKAYITLADGSINTLRGVENAGIKVNEGASVTIGGTGTLNAIAYCLKGGSGGAGIGSQKGCDAGNITINGGVVNARVQNSCDSAGIGGGGTNDGGSITITGGTVYAEGRTGIGGGTAEQPSANVRIDAGADVVAVGGRDGSDAPAILDTDGAVTSSGGGKTAAGVLMATYASSVNNNVLTEIRDAGGNALVPERRINSGGGLNPPYRSAAFTLPGPGDYTLYKNETQQVGTNVKGAANSVFTVLPGLNAFSNVKDSGGLWTDGAEADPDAVFGGGSGTAGEPYLISSDNDLVQLAVNLSAGSTYEGKFFSLTSDIQLAAHFWEGAGTFKGTFDGRGHTISGIKIVNEENPDQGLFGRTSGAVLKDLRLTGAVIRAGSAAGALAGSAESTAITDCYVRGTISGDAGVGGLVGAASGATTLERCMSDVTVSAGSSAGGLVGAAGDGLAMTDCSGIGTVSADGENAAAGGLAGSLAGGGTFSNAYFAGSVSAAGGVSGAVYGSAGQAPSCTNCWYDSAEHTDAVTVAGVAGKTPAEMKTPAFASVLGAKWSYSACVNNGYPYLTAFIALSEPSYNSAGGTLDFYYYTIARGSAALIAASYDGLKLTDAVTTESGGGAVSLAIGAAAAYKVFALDPVTSAPLCASVQTP